MGLSSAFNKAANLAASAKKATIKATSTAWKTTSNATSQAWDSASRNLQNAQQNFKSQKAARDLKQAHFQERLESMSTAELERMFNQGKLSMSERKVVHDVYKRRTGKSLLLNGSMQSAKDMGEKAKDLGSRAKDGCLRTKDRCQDAVKDLWDRYKK